MSQELADWLKRYGLLLTFLGAFLSGFLSPIGLDNLVSAYAFLGAALVFALAAWRVWVIPPRYERYKPLIKWLALLLIIAIAAGWGYFLWWASQPHFEIRALDTLEADRNAYEVTDQLLWNYDELDRYGVAITFTLEIVPRYTGKREFGSVVALISGDGDKIYEKELWPHFESGASTRHIQLTLEELAQASGLQKNSDPPVNRFRPGDPFFQQAGLVVQIAQAADKEHPWASERIIIRNTPWELQSALVERDGQRAVDVLVENLGGTGKFTVRYRLVRLEKEIDSSSKLPEVSGTTSIAGWNEPDELVRLERGQFFTDTVFLPKQLAQGRYLVEAYAVKKQHYVQFADPNATFSRLNSLNSPWWFGGYPSNRHIFVVTTPEFPIDATVQAEWERLWDEEGIDLGIALEPAEEVTLETGDVVLRQVFQEGEILLHDGQTYALYGLILEHYRQLGGAECNGLEYPVSPIQTTTSGAETEGKMMAFRGLGDTHPLSIIYASDRGVGMIEGWIGRIYEDNGGHRGWLGFPLSDPHDHSDSTIQVFEGGYVVNYYPEVEGERDWGRKPVVYPYIAGRGALVDVYANLPWQDTGVHVQQGDRITIVQVDGTWSAWESGLEPHDANGIEEWTPDEEAPLPQAYVGALIARVGTDSDDIFLVGRWGEHKSQAEGNLYLAMNDKYVADNAGLLTVQIIITPAEE